MKKTIFTLLVVLFAGVVLAQDTTAAKDSMVFIMVEETPQFPGGEAAMMKFISANIQYPAEAVENNIEGKVYVQFIVEKDGTISTIKVTKSAHPLLDAEAVRVIKIMPEWKPGRQQGQYVRVRFTLPVNFELN